MPSLLTAVLRNQKLLVEDLLKSGVDANQRWVDGMTSLHVATQHQLLPTARLLLHYGGHVNVTDNIGCTPLHYAAMMNDPDCAEFLCHNGADVSFTDLANRTPLDIASQRGNDKVLNILLQYKPANHISALYLACKSGHPDIIQSLCDSGTDVNSVGPDGYTALLHACEGGHLECVKILLRYKADVAHTTPGGHGPLHIACRSNRPDIVEELLDYGAEIQVYSKDNQLPCGLGSSKECTELIHRWLEKPRRSKLEVSQWVEKVSKYYCSN